jgi:hypothetical protein
VWYKDGGGYLHYAEYGRKEEKREEKGVGSCSVEKPESVSGPWLSNVV